MATMFKAVTQHSLSRGARRGADFMQASAYPKLRSGAKKPDKGVGEIIHQNPINKRLYKFVNNDDGSVSAIAQVVEDIAEIDAHGRPVFDENGEPIVVLGVKTKLIAEVKKQQSDLLFFTDGAVSRSVYNRIAVPENIAAWRMAIRVRATAMEEAIINAKDTAAVAALFVSSDGDRNKRGLLFDWPEFS